jgi:hypothetical protein
MKLKTAFSQFVAVGLMLLMAAPLALAQEPGGRPVFKQEELDQMMAPIALYPDSLLAQVLMASTYPLEVVQADRWAKQNKDLKGDALATALEKQSWDPSVKSLVNFPDVLAMMSDKLDWTTRLGDAFLSQQEAVMNTVQKLRKKAEEQGNLKSDKEQKVMVEKETIIIQPANPQVVYVPVYNPTVVYGTWWWPAYPPYYYYPPYYPRPALYGFGAGVAVGVAWGYAWGSFNWHNHAVHYNVNQNININRNINRNQYVQHYGSGSGNWQHRPEHRKGVSYRDQNTARQYNRAATNNAVRSRENFRGRAESGRQDIRRGGADQFKGGQTAGQRGGQKMERGGVSPSQTNRGGAFSGMDRSGGATRDMSNRGSSSRQSMSSGSRGGGGFGGGGRGGGGSRGGRR